MGRGRACAVDELANGLLALGVRKGDAFGILAQTSLEWALFDYALARVGAVGAAIYANSSPKDCRYVLEHSDAVGVLVEDEAQRAKIADVAARPRAHLRRPGRAARPRPRVRRGQPGRARRRRGADRRGGPLHLHLHLGHDRAAEGLHDPPPQLLRDGDVHRPRAGVRARRRRDAALPAAGAQLRAADAPARRAQGLHDRLLPGPAARRRGDAGRAPDAAAERAAALREGAHGRAGAVRAGARAAAAAARLGARRRPAA